MGEVNVTGATVGGVTIEVRALNTVEIGHGGDLAERGVAQAEVNSNQARAARISELLNSVQKHHSSIERLATPDQFIRSNPARW